MALSPATNPPVGELYYRDAIIEARFEDTPWIATLESEANTFMALWQWDGASEDWSRLDENDDLAQGNTNSRIQWTPTDGEEYRLTLTLGTAASDE